MKLENNTILITGGSSGIGLETARQLAPKNKVIICGRSRERLDNAQKEISGIHTLVCDLSKEEDCRNLHLDVSTRFPECNILIHNAALVQKTDFLTDAEAIKKADLEMKTNFTGPVMLTKWFLPLLAAQAHAKLIFISTGLIYAPKAAYLAYCPSKSALHAFTQTLQWKLRGSRPEIIEVLMPVVDTPFHQGNPPKGAISTTAAVKEMLPGIEKGKKTIRIGGVKLLYLISRFSPALGMRIVNKM